jgi:hypothetical protein
LVELSALGGVGAVGVPVRTGVFKVALLTVPPVIATALAFWVLIVPSPLIAVLGIVGDAVIAAAPLPIT